jgi:hypothetical protein
MNHITEYSKKRIREDLTKLQKKLDKLKTSIENHNAELQQKMDLYHNLAKTIQELTMMEQQLKTIH